MIPNQKLITFALISNVKLSSFSIFIQFEHARIIKMINVQIHFSKWIWTLWLHMTYYMMTDDYILKLNHAGSIEHVHVHNVEFLKYFYLDLFFASKFFFFFRLISFLCAYRERWNVDKFAFSTSQISAYVESVLSEKVLIEDFFFY